MKLRWYQEQAVAAVWDYLRNKDGAPCVVLPTGSGKTPVIAELCRQVVEWGGRVVVLAHVKELLEQAADKLARFMLADLVGIYSAGLGERETQTPVVVAGIQSIYTRAEELGPVQLIIIDEAHLIPTTGEGRYRQFIEAARRINPQVRLVGLTATPYRMGCGWITKDRAQRDGQDGDGEDRLLDSVVYEVPTDRLIADGTLSSVRSVAAKRAPDFSGVHITRGDFDEQEIERVLNSAGVVESAAREIVEKTADRSKVVVFCNRRESARKVARLLAEYAPDFEAATIDGDTSAGDRADLIRRFKNERGDALLLGGESKPLKYICNVGVLTTGFDAPNVDAVAILRPTQSLALYQQIVGRGLRRAPEKADCLVLDFGGNIDRHGPIDLPVVTANPDGRKAWKTCKQCGAIVAASLKVCPMCAGGFEGPRREVDPNAGLTRRSSTSAIISTAPDAPPPVMYSDHRVERVEYSAHYKKDAPPDKPPTLCVEYYCPGFFRPLREYLCPEHTGWPRKKFEKWWRERSRVDPPAAAETAAAWANAGALGVPHIITEVIKDGETFHEIKWKEADPPPSFDPATVQTWQDELDEVFGLPEFAGFEDTSGKPPRNCGACRSYCPDDLTPGGFCVRTGKDTTPDAAPCAKFEAPIPDDYDDLPF